MILQAPHAEARALPFNSSFLKKDASSFLLQGIEPCVLDDVWAIQNLSFGMTQNHLDTCMNQRMQKSIAPWLCNTAQLQRTVWLPCILLAPPFGCLQFSFLCTLNSHRRTESCSTDETRQPFCRDSSHSPALQVPLLQTPMLLTPLLVLRLAHSAKNPIFAAATRGICAVASCSSPLSQTGRKAKASLLT